MKSHIITIFDGDNVPMQFDLSEINNTTITFGRNDENDIKISSKLISKFHGYFTIMDNAVLVVDKNSTNGIYIKGEKVQSHKLSDGDIIKIDDINNPMNRGVSIIYELKNSDAEWNNFLIGDRKEILIGRDSSCDICIKHILVSKVHIKIQRCDDGFYLIDNHSDTGVSVNGKLINGKMKLAEKDFVLMANMKMIFSSTMISYYVADQGMTIEAVNLVKTVKSNSDWLTITNHVDVHINAGEFVSIIGGSGAGKTTVMNCISGYDQADSGTVLVNGTDLKEGYEILKSVIGYVPQQDIVYDNLTLFAMLEYAARLRMPADVEEEERKEHIANVLEMVELTGKEDTYIYSLSGGQKKRASIAVELLSEPNLFFLDEPTSGLDPGTETHIMRTLRNLSNKGKTVILVTHNIANIELCDRLIVMGKGGNLCFSGRPEKALDFFGVDRLCEVYDKVTDNPIYWKQRFDLQKEDRKYDQKNMESANRNKKGKKSVLRQCSILSARYFHLVLNDKQRLIMLLLQAPLLAVLIYFVTNGEQYKEYEVTKSIFFALSCCAFWLGILNSIQEICKERNVFKREYMSGVHIRSYVLSKYIILGLLCAVQTILLVGGFALLVGLPSSGIVIPAFFELTITTFLTAYSATSMGVFVSCLFANPDRAMTTAPILLMPQILFSGLAFELAGVKEKISVFVNCRWAMEGFGTTVNLNDLDMKMQKQFPQLQHTPEDMFRYTNEHLITSWGMLVLFIILFSILAILVLDRSIRRGGE